MIRDIREGQQPTNAHRQTVTVPPGEGMLTRAECNVLRGLAIIGIFLHNYCHWLGPVVKENEYTFSTHNVGWLHQVLSSPDGLLPMHLLSFYGHYGVPIFLFLSAYGLERKYGSRPLPATGAGQSAFRFIRYHFLKLFKMVVVGFAAFTMVDAITPGRFHYDVVKVLGQLFMFGNLLPDPDHQIWPGPYWFFGLMLQLYIVYRLLLYRRHWGVTAVLVVACMAAQMVCGPESDALNRLRYNCVGAMLPFGFGLLCARFPMYMNKTYCWLLMAVSAMMVYSLGDGYYGWFFVPVFVCSLAFTLVKVLPQWLFRPLEWMGGISAALFVCHPITRKIFIPISRQGDLYTGLLLYVVASVCLAWLFRELFKRIPNPKP